MRSAKFVLVVLMSGSIALAGEAVSEMNGKLGYAGGSMDGDSGNNVFGSFSLPLAPNFGLQIYFGPSKTLIRRHREDDPPSVVRQVLDGIGLYGTEFNKRGAEYVESLDGDSGGGDYGYGVIVTSYGGFEEWAIRTSAPAPSSP